MAKYLVELKDGCEGNCRDCLKDCDGFPYIVSQAVKVEEVGAHTNINWVNTAHSNGKIYYVDGKPVKLYSVEDR